MPALEGELRVLIVAADPLVRAGLGAMLAGRPGYTVAGQGTGEDDLSDDLAGQRPDVVLWDLGWDAAPALERLADLPEGGPPVVALLPDGLSASEAWAAGARGLLPRTSDPSMVVEALRAAAQGLAVLEPSLAAGLAPGREPRPGPTTEELTPRELEVLHLLGDGLPNKAIAQRLAISEHTVKFHITAIFGKLNAQSRTEAVAHAMRLGLLPL